jgi:hypothetical protein
LLQAPSGPAAIEFRAGEGVEDSLFFGSQDSVGLYELGLEGTSDMGSGAIGVAAGFEAAAAARAEAWAAGARADEEEEDEEDGPVVPSRGPAAAKAQPAKRAAAALAAPAAPGAPPAQSAAVPPRKGIGVGVSRALYCAPFARAHTRAH